MGYIYLICDLSNSLYKIGVTREKNNKRLKKLQTGNPTELHICIWYKCEYPFRLETMLHNYFKNNNVLNEWFELDDDTVLNFEKICDKFNKNIELLKNNPFFSKNLK